MSAVFLFGDPAAQAAHPAARTAKTDDSAPSGPLLSVAGFKFVLPAKWISVTPENDARVGQWQVPGTKLDASDAGEAVAYYFGPTAGGTAKENIEAWIGTIFDAEGHPAAAKVSHRVVGNFKVSEVAIFGAYDQASSLPGVPPIPRMNYGLVGVVIEGPQGSVFWRFTGPEPLITANLPIFNKIIDSLKPQDK